MYLQLLKNYVVYKIVHNQINHDQFYSAIIIISLCVLLNSSKHKYEEKLYCIFIMTSLFFFNLSSGMTTISEAYLYIVCQDMVISRIKYKCNFSWYIGILYDKNASKHICSYQFLNRLYYISYVYSPIIILMVKQLLTGRFKLSGCPDKQRKILSKCMYFNICCLFVVFENIFLG